MESNQGPGLYSKEEQLKYSNHIIFERTKEQIPANTAIEMCVDQDLCGPYRYQEDGSTILPSSTRGPFLDFHKGIVGFIWSNVSPYLSSISFVVLWVHVLYSIYKERKRSTKRESSTTQLNVAVQQTPIGWTGSAMEHI